MARKQETIPRHRAILLHPQQQKRLRAVHAHIVALNQPEDASPGVNDASRARIQLIAEFANRSFHAGAQLLIHVLVPVQYARDSADRDLRLDSDIFHGRRSRAEPHDLRLSRCRALTFS